jgi:hypothetical protein
MLAFVGALLAIVIFIAAPYSLFINDCGPGIPSASRHLWFLVDFL